MTNNFRGYEGNKKNFGTAKMQKGGLDGALFSTPGYNCIGDPYEDPGKFKLRSESATSRKNLHNNEFRTGGRVKHKDGSDYLNTPDLTRRNVSANRTWGPRGFFTSPNKKGIAPGSLLQRNPYPHMADEYDRKKDMMRDELMRQRALDLANGFKNVVKGKDTFGSNKDEYGEDKLNIQDKRLAKKYGGVKHPQPWKYNNESRFAKKTINEVPAYIDEKKNDGPIEAVVRKQNEMPWYYTYNRRSEPADTIMHHFKNKPKYAFLK
eukprot:CAMPEP_0197010962 /NCGR_PEP_ID=MMETSP1380-20130617/56547_1 /TAXON_ID=5936 /ORGANISM="Euplotes crassus, Strain CT5" /LENGTH=263 /DNA_ID=CAMNT_0042433275 /DNA_START=192 /DNA_END=983 /DNA_ORIENTATION=-